MKALLLREGITEFISNTAAIFELHVISRKLDFTAQFNFNLSGYWYNQMLIIGRMMSLTQILIFASC